jgi:amidohydrolase
MRQVPQDLYDRLVALRRELHRYPELSWEETRTAGVIRLFLQGLGIQCCTNVAGTGVVADISGKTGVPCVVLRADTAALPIQEETGLEFASVHDGGMHACGHDGHTTMLLGADLQRGAP